MTARPGGARDKRASIALFYGPHFIARVLPVCLFPRASAELEWPDCVKNEAPIDEFCTASHCQM